MKYTKMSEAEREIMEFIWDADDCVSSNDVMAGVSDHKGWKLTTTLTFLTRLTEKSMIVCEKKGKTNQYRPAVAREEFTQSEALSFLNSTYNGSVKSFVSALYDSEGITREEIDKLRDWVDSLED